jgi:hypothetical protein
LIGRSNCCDQFRERKRRIDLSFLTWEKRHSISGDRDYKRSRIRFFEH